MVRVAVAFVLAIWAIPVAAQTEVRLVEELRIGSVEGSEFDMFGDIHDLTVDLDGRIYVLDPGMRDVRLFDRNGRFIRRIAPEGEGPGERRHRQLTYGAPARVTWDRHRGWLWVDDGAYFQVMDSLGTEYMRNVWQGSFYTNPDKPVGKLVAVDTSGRIYEHQRRPVGDSTVSYIARGVATLDYGATYRDTLVLDVRGMVRGEPQTTLRTIENAVVTMTMTHERPERDERPWAVSPSGTVWIASLDGWLHELTFASDTIRTFAIGSAPAELDVSPEGWVWLRRVSGEDESAWDLLDNCGSPHGNVSVPYPVWVTEVGPGGGVHVVTSDDFDIEYVVRLRLEGREMMRRSC